MLRARRLALWIVLPALGGCSLDWDRYVYDAAATNDVGTDIVARDATVDAADAADATDAADAPDVMDAIDVADATDVIDVIDVTDASGDTGVMDAVSDATLDAGDTGVFEQTSCVPAQVGCGLVEVTPGSFVLGDPAVDSSVPVQPVTLTQPFAVDAYEVTVGRFRRFWDAGHPAPSGPIAYPGRTLAFTGSVSTPVLYGNDAGPNQFEFNWTDAPDGGEDQPMNGASFWTAMAFCVWDGGRLPTEAEWEYIARARPITGGPAGEHEYVWGDDPAYGMDCANVNWGSCNLRTTSVTDRPPVEGVYDLAGNVIEWVADAFRSYSDPACWDGGTQTNPLCSDVDASVGRVRRGGAYETDYLGVPQKYYAAYRYSGRESSEFETTGFRCVRTR